jgi:hypothetical protein
MAGMPGDPASLAERFRTHAGFCQRSGAPLYRELLSGLAADLDAGGVTARICAGWESSSTGDVVQLRLLAALHRLVLTGHAPGLQRFYRSVGGTAAPGDAWPHARRVLTDRADQVRAALALVPQTNETGRSAALAVGLSALAGLSGSRAASVTGPTRVRLLELGASAGLNLLVDRFRIEGRWHGRPWTWGPAGSRVRMADAVTDATDPFGTDGSAGAAGRDLRDPVRPEPGPVELVDRAGCDLRPVDPRSESGALHLRSYVWPDHVDRMTRLDAALAIACAAGPGAAPVQQEAAAPWLRRRLEGHADPGVLTVVWHSVVLQYLPQSERDALDQVIEEARRRMALARLCLESALAPHDTPPVLWLDGRALAGASAHGPPVRLAGPVAGPHAERRLRGEQPHGAPS